FHSGAYTEWINVTGMTELYTLSSHDLSIAQVMPGSVTARITAAGDTKLSAWLTELPVIRDEVLLHVEQAADTGLPDMALTLLDAGYEQAFYRGASKNLVMLEIINNISPIQIRAVRLGGDDIAFDTPFGSDYSLCPQVYEWDHSAAACDTALISMDGIGRVDNSIPMATSMSMEGTYNQPAQDLRLFLFHDADVNWNDDSVAIEIDIMTDAGEYRTLILDIPIKSDAPAVYNPTPGSNWLYSTMFKVQNDDPSGPEMRLVNSSGVPYRKGDESTAVSNALARPNIVSAEFRAIRDSAKLTLEMNLPEDVPDATLPDYSRIQAFAIPSSQSLASGNAILG